MAHARCDNQRLIRGTLLSISSRSSFSPAEVFPRRSALRTPSRRRLITSCLLSLEASRAMKRTIPATARNVTIAINSAISNSFAISQVEQDPNPLVGKPSIPLLLNGWRLEHRTGKVNTSDQQTLRNLRADSRGHKLADYLAAIADTPLLDRQRCPASLRRPFPFP